MPITQKLKKHIKSLHQKQFRDQTGMFIAEGEKLAQELIASDFEPELVVIKDSPSSIVLECVERFSDKGVPIYHAPKHQFDQICDTKTPQNILVVANSKDFELDTSKSFIALDGVSDPGNVGTIIRTAHWFGFEQVLLGKDCADKYNPKTVRATMGSLFRTIVYQNDDLPSLLNENFKSFKFYGATSKEAKSIKNYRPKKNFGLIFGSESKGYSDDIAKILNYEYIIDGSGSADSLNVAIAAGISIYHFAQNLEI